MSYTLQVDLNEAQLLLNLLAEGQYKTVAMLIAKLHGQITQQDQEAQAKKPDLQVVPKEVEKAVDAEVG